VTEAPLIGCRWMHSWTWKKHAKDSCWDKTEIFLSTRKDGLSLLGFFCRQVKLAHIDSLKICEVVQDTSKEKLADRWHYILESVVTTMQNTSFVLGI